MSEKSRASHHRSTEEPSAERVVIRDRRKIDPKRKLTIVGARVYTRDDFASAIALLDSGVIPADELITKVVPLPDAGTAFAELAAGGAMKILIDCQAGRPS